MKYLVFHSNLSSRLFGMMKDEVRRDLKEGIKSFSSDNA